MNLRIEIRSAVKAGNSNDENEDRAAFRLQGDQLRLAIADGATESSFSGSWAKALVRTWTETEHQSLDRAYLATARQSWVTGLPDPERLSWYAQEKLEMGSHASLACLTMTARRRGFAWSGHLVGDCEVFVLKGRRRLWLRRRAPIVRASDFGYAPRLVSTQPYSWDEPMPGPLKGRVHDPFELWLTTDAFAHSCLAATESGQAPWSKWGKALETADAFAEEVDRARQNGQMRNDDVTVLRVRGT